MGAAWIKDAFGQSELVLHSLKLACDFLKQGGWFITKVGAPPLSFRCVVTTTLAHASTGLPPPPGVSLRRLPLAAVGLPAAVQEGGGYQASLLAQCLC